MPITVSELREIVKINISGIEIKNLDEFDIVFVDSSGNEINIDDTGDYDVIESSLCGDTINNYFVFLSKGLGESSLSYSLLMNMLDKADDNALVYLLKDLRSIPPIQNTMVAVEGAKLNVTRLSSLSENNNKITKGILTLKDQSFICSSSSSSS